MGLLGLPGETATALVVGNLINLGFRDYLRLEVVTGREKIV
ncbi:MAG: hypothetical protein ACYDG6_02745 [Thermincolia bacterium]